MVWESGAFPGKREELAQQKDRQRRGPDLGAEKEGHEAGAQWPVGTRQTGALARTGHLESLLDWRVLGMVVV